MKTGFIKKRKEKIACTTVNTLLTVEYVFVLDLIVTCLFRAYWSPFLFPAALIAAFIAFSILPIKNIKKRMALSFIPPLLIFLIAGIYFAVDLSLRKQCDYKTIHYPSEEFFSDKKVMVIVPHEDDDLNLVGGVIEKYVENGSEIFIVFATNGDYFDKAEMRINDAVSCWQYLGVPEKNVYFLGYGDRWSTEGPHIYNASADQPLKSAVGRTETYGTATHPAYHNGNAYTFRNYSNDIMQIILEKRPDILFISDYDKHPDHKAVSLCSEYVLGKILKSTSDYQPIVYKGYTYSTAWEAADDFRSLNLKSTQQPIESEYEPMVYDWNSRVRFPVNGNTMSRSILSTKYYKAFAIYRGQSARSHLNKIINGDKVFWQRRTDSLLYTSKVKVSSGDGSYLTDFRIIDSDDINDRKHSPYDRVWTPDAKDAEKTIHVVLKKESDIYSINLYDHPSPDDNITNIRITFSDGSSVETGHLNRNGLASEITVKKKKIKSFDIKIVSYEGDNPGLCEIEAFRKKGQYDGTFIKLMDNEGNFVYDYFAESDTSEFMLYSNHQIPDLTESSYSVSCDNTSCSCLIQNERLVVTCPKGESCKIALVELSSGLSDQIYVSHPDALTKAKNICIQKIENDYLFVRTKASYENLYSYRFFLKGKVQ